MGCRRAPVLGRLHVLEATMHQTAITLHLILLINQLGVLEVGTRLTATLSVYFVLLMVLLVAVPVMEDGTHLIKMQVTTSSLLAPSKVQLLQDRLKVAPPATLNILESFSQ